jgi:hypothetical protein
LPRHTLASLASMRLRPSALLPPVATSERVGTAPSRSSVLSARVADHSAASGPDRRTGRSRSGSHRRLALRRAQPTSPRTATVRRSPPYGVTVSVPIMPRRWCSLMKHQ